MKEIFKSIFLNLKNLKTIIINRWHLHIPIAYIIGIYLYKYIGYNITDIYIVSKILLKIFVPSFLGFLGLYSFECLQQGKRLIGFKELFESNKDLWVGEISLILGVITGYFIYIN